MTTSFAIKFIAACAMIYWTSSSFPHENHGQNLLKGSEMAAEQKDWGIAGEAKAVQRTITIRMGDDMRFTPAHLDIQQGQTVRLVIQNSGKQLHELVIGSKPALTEHAAQMLKFPTMEHDAPDMAHVAAGKSGEIIWHFNRAGDFAFACLIPGHYQAGMVGTIRVNAVSPTATPYAGQQQRNIKALSPEEVKAYTEGMGFGFAKAAELNGYPGPMHTLELADTLNLTDEQRTQTRALLTRHKAEARRIGAELIAAERALDQAFATQRIDDKQMAPLIAAAGEKLTQLRTTHLQAHLTQTALLTPEQISNYQNLRGYAQNESNAHSGHHPEPSATTPATVEASSNMTEGEVRTVNKSAQKITLKHGEIKNLGMGAMTMVFQVKDPAFLDNVKAGDKVRFTAEQIKGAFVVMSIEKVAP